MNLKNISSIVTGGASGLGAATAAALAAAGSRVAILDVNEALAKKTADAIGALAIHCDVTDEDSVKNALDMATKAKWRCANIGKLRRRRRIIENRG